MAGRKWLRKEIPEWVKDNVISAEEGREILERYHEEPQSFMEVFIILAGVSLGAGGLFLGAAFWNHLTQDERFIAVLIPLILSTLFMAAVILLDRKVKIVHHKKKQKRRSVFMEAVLPDGTEVAEEDISRPQYTTRIPVYVKEMIYAFHGASLLIAVWLMNDTFLIVDSLPLFASMCAGLLLILMYAFESVSFSVLYVVAAVAISLSAPFTGWVETVSWVFMAAAVPNLLMLLRHGRQQSLICLSWIWTMGILLLISKSTNTLWEMMFFSEAAAFAWIVGSMMRSYTMAGTAVRFLGSSAMFIVLMISSFGNLWRGHLEMPRGWLLWSFYGIILAIIAYFGFRSMKKKEWLASLSGMVPLAMLFAALSDIWDVSGATAGIIVSFASAILSLAVILRGVETGRSWQGMLGFILLCITGMLRMLDSTLTLTQRGIYFLIGGIIIAGCCAGFYHVKNRGHKRRKKKSLERRQLEEAERTIARKVEKPGKVNITTIVKLEKPEKLTDIKVPVFHMPKKEEGDRKHE